MRGVLLVPSSSPALPPIYDGLDVNVTSNITWFHLNHDMVLCRIYELSFYGGHSITCPLYRRTNYCSIICVAVKSMAFFFIFFHHFFCLPPSFFRLCSSILTRFAPAIYMMYVICVSRCTGGFFCPQWPSGHARGHRCRTLLAPGAMRRDQTRAPEPMS